MSGWTDATDEDVLHGIARRDESALGALYDRYNRRTYGLAYRVLGEQGAAEEVVQEVFLNIWRRVGSFEAGRGSAERWILSIAHHRAIDRLRGRAGRARDEIPLDQLDRVLTIDDPWQDVDRVLRREELQRWLASLPEAQRRIIELAYFDGYLQHEIAAMIDVPLGTVKARTRAALQKLRALPEALMAWEPQGDAAPRPGTGGPATEQSG